MPEQPSRDSGVAATGVTVAGDIGELAEARLRGHSYLGLKNIHCEYQGGVLTLRGWLSSYYLKQLALASVAGLGGVDRIDNQIEVVAAAARGFRDQRP